MIYAAVKSYEYKPESIITSIIYLYKYHNLYCTPVTKQLVIDTLKRIYADQMNELVLYIVVYHVTYVPTYFFENPECMERIKYPQFSL